MHPIHSENQGYWQYNEKECYLKEKEEESTSHVVDGSDVGIAKLVEKGSQWFIIFLIEIKHLFVDQTTRENVQLSQTENYLVDILSDTRDIY